MLTRVESNASRLSNGLNSVFENLIFPELNGFSSSLGLMDIYEDENYAYIEIDVPSFEAKDINIESLNRKIIISGEKTLTDNSSEKKNYKIKERTSSKFRRMILLDESFNVSDMEAEIKDGVLKITVPKMKKAETKKIEIKKR